MTETKIQEAEEILEKGKAKIIHPQARKYTEPEIENLINSQNAQIKAGPPKATINTGRFYITSPTLIRTPQLDKPFEVLFALETGERISIAEFTVKNKSNPKRLIGAIGLIITSILVLAVWLWTQALILVVGVGVICMVITTIAVLMQKPATTKKTSPFDYGMSVPQQGGGVESAFDALTYMQIPMIQVSQPIMDKINDLEQIFTNSLESINAVDTIKEKFLPNKQGWWDKHGQMAMMMGFTVIMIVLILAGSYIIGQQQIQSWSSAGSNFLQQWGALASKLTGVTPPPAG